MKDEWQIANGLKCGCGGADEYCPCQNDPDQFNPARPQIDHDAQALAGYRAAIAFVASDAWDGCSDCIEILKAARCADFAGELTSDQIAENLKRIRMHFSHSDQRRENEISRLRRIIHRYGDRHAMARCHRPDWQREIDDAMGWVADNPETDIPNFPSESP